MATTNYASIRPWPGGIQSLSATSSTAVGINTAVFAVSAASATFPQPNLMFVVAETNSVRWRDDGTDPTATVGIPLPVNTGFLYDGDIRKIKFIGTAGQGIVNCAFYSAGP